MTRIPDHAAHTLIETNGRFFAAALLTEGDMPSEIVRSALRAKKLLPIVGATSAQATIKRAFDQLQQSRSVALHPCTESRQPVYISSITKTIANQAPPIVVDLTLGEPLIHILESTKAKPFAQAYSAHLVDDLGDRLASEVRIRLPRIRAAAISHEREAVRIASSHWMSTFALISNTAARCGQTA